MKVYILVRNQTGPKTYGSTFDLYLGGENTQFSIYHVIVCRLHLFTDEIYLQKRSCTFSKMKQSSGAHTAQPYNTVGRTITFKRM